MTPDTGTVADGTRRGTPGSDPCRGRSVRVARSCGARGARQFDSRSTSSPCRSLSSRTGYYRGTPRSLSCHVSPVRAIPCAAHAVPRSLMVSRGIATRFLLADDRAATSSLKSVQPFDISDPSSGWAPGVPAESMSDQWRLQKGGKLMGWYGRVIHGDSRCGIDLSRDST